MHKLMGNNTYFHYRTAARIFTGPCGAIWLSIAISCRAACWFVGKASASIPRPVHFGQPAARSSGSVNTPDGMNSVNPRGRWHRPFAHSCPDPLGLNPRATEARDLAILR